MKKDEHPAAEQLERFLSDQLPGVERRTVVRHLLTGCPRCTAATRQLWTLTGGPEPVSLRHDLPRDSSRRESRRRRPSAASRAVLPAEPIVGAAAAAPVENHHETIPHPAAYRGVLERAIERGLERERELAVEREEAPRLVARLLLATPDERQRLAEDDPHLPTCAVVETLLDRGEFADPAAEAATAAELAELALTIAERLDRRRCGVGVARELARRAWAALGEARHRDGDLPGARRALTAARALHRPSAPRVETGERTGAPPAAETAAPLASAADTESTLDSEPRLRWLEGKIALAEGRTVEAEAALVAARAGLLARGLGRDAAVASLDLAALFLRAGRWSELRQLASELYPIFAARDMRREALMSLLVFRRATESETVTAELLLEIAHYLGGFAIGPRSRAA